MADAILREFRDLIARHTNVHVDAWKASGRPVVGTFCHYMPPELILAAGALPLRLRGAGSEDSSLADAFMSGRVCTYVRHVMNLVLEGEYGFLDGAICLNTCDHVRRTADLFRAKTTVPYHGFLSVPRNPRESLYPYYLEELRKLIRELGEQVGRPGGDTALREAIVELNRVRDLLRKVDQARRGDCPTLTGAESLTVHIASQVLPPAIFRELASKLLTALQKGRSGGEWAAEPRAQVVVVGAELDEPELLEVIEGQGARVVGDRLCFGARSVLDPIDETANDPLDAIGRAYFFRPSCARMIGDFPKRWDSLRDLVDECRADGVIFERLMFCDPWGADLHNTCLRAKKESAFPVLTITREYGIIPSGQLRTRVQAFVERIEIARAQRESEGVGS